MRTLKTVFEFAKWTPIYLGWFCLVWLYFSYMMGFELGWEGPAVKILALVNVAWWALYEFPRLVCLRWWRPIKYWAIRVLLDGTKRRVLRMPNKTEADIELRDSLILQVRAIEESFNKAQELENEGDTMSTKANKVQVSMLDALSAVRSVAALADR